MRSRATSDGLTVIHEAGEPEVLKIESTPIRAPKSGEILMRVKEFDFQRLLDQRFPLRAHRRSISKGGREAEDEEFCLWLGARGPSALLGIPNPRRIVKRGGELQI